MARLKAENVAILYISHRMHEVEALADRASVFRNGRHIETFDKGQRSTAEIVQLMIGRDIADAISAKAQAGRGRRRRLKVERLGWEDRLADISLEVGAGEIVGLGGLDGQGQKTLLLALFGVLRGVDRRDHGQWPCPSRPRSPAKAKAPDVGIALVPEDRKTEGLMLPMSIADNLTIASLGALSIGPFVDAGKEAEAVDGGDPAPSIKVGSKDDAVSTLSGGNQQKVVIAKWLMTEPRIILLNDPTRGIDVGTKQELYRLMRELADQGAAILFYSTDYDELIGCCDRVAIMYDGRIVRELAGDELNETNIVASSLNIGAAPSSGARSEARLMSDLAIKVRQNFAFLTAVVLFAVVYLPLQPRPSQGLQLGGVHPEQQRGVHAGAGLDGADRARSRGRPRPFGRRLDDDGRLFRELSLERGARGTPLALDFGGWRLALGTLPGGVTGIVFGAVICLLIGAIAGFINGAVVVYGRIQPIIATLATGAIYIGIALFLRPQPGGKVNDDLNWALTNSLGDFASTVHIFNDGAAPWFAPFAGIPTPFVLLALIVLLVWVPFSRTVTGRTVYAIGSAEGAAYMSGLDVNRARIAAFTLGGFFAPAAGCSSRSRPPRATPTSRRPAPIP